MNLGKLLFAGKSVVNGQGAAAYRENKNVRLPKFNLAKKSFGNPVKAPAETPDATVKKKTASPFAAKSPESPVLATRPATWASKLNPISMLRPAPSMAPERPVVQTELSLDTVKVVHNDLSDADVQVVPMKSRSAAEADEQSLPATENPWESLTKRLLKATAL